MDFLLSAFSPFTRMYTSSNKSQSFGFLSLLSHFWGSLEPNRCQSAVVSVVKGQASALQPLAEGLHVFWYGHICDFWPVVWRSLMLLLLFSLLGHYLRPSQCHVASASLFKVMACSIKYKARNDILSKIILAWICMFFTDIVDICISVYVPKPIVHGKLQSTHY